MAKRLMTIANLEEDELLVFAGEGFIGRVTGRRPVEVPEEYLVDGTRLALDSARLEARDGVHRATIGIGCVTFRTYRGLPPDAPGYAFGEGNLVKEGDDWLPVDMDWSIVVDRVAARNRDIRNDHHLPIGTRGPDVEVNLCGRGRPVPVRVNPECLMPQC